MLSVISASAGSSYRPGREDFGGGGTSRTSSKVRPSGYGVRHGGIYGNLGELQGQPAHPEATPGPYAPDGRCAPQVIGAGALEGLVGCRCGAIAMSRGCLRRSIVWRRSSGRTSRPGRRGVGTGGRPSRLHLRAHRCMQNFAPAGLAFWQTGHVRSRRAVAARSSAHRVAHHAGNHHTDRRRRQTHARGRSPRRASQGRSRASPRRGPALNWT
jgi:hypothetical protein